jgi:hypothetical protein
MTLDLRQIIDDAELPEFRFIGPDGADRALPHLQALTPRQALAAMDGDLEEVLQSIAPDVASMLLDIPAHATNTLIEEWMRHSGIDPTAVGEPGKSSAPSRSSAGTRKPSKRTSKSAASRSRR